MNPFDLTARGHMPAEWLGHVFPFLHGRFSEFPWLLTNSLPTTQYAGTRVSLSGSTGLSREGLAFSPSPFE